MAISSRTNRDNLTRCFPFAVVAKQLKASPCQTTCRYRTHGAWKTIRRTYAARRSVTTSSYVDPNENTTTWAYDDLDRVTSETNELGHARTFTYDIVSRLTQRVDRNGRVMKFDYDDLGRVTGERWYTNLADTTANHTISTG